LGKGKSDTISDLRKSACIESIVCLRVRGVFSAHMLVEPLHRKKGRSKGSSHRKKEDNKEKGRTDARRDEAGAIGGEGVGTKGRFIGLVY